MKKKKYEAPIVRKVRLEIKNAILAVCHASPNTDPIGTFGCTMTTGCYSPPG